MIEMKVAIEIQVLPPPSLDQGLERSGVGGRYDQGPAGSQKAPPPAQELDGLAHVLDNVEIGEGIERCVAERRVAEGAHGNPRLERGWQRGERSDRHLQAPGPPTALERLH